MHAYVTFSKLTCGVTWKKLHMGDSNHGPIGFFAVNGSFSFLSMNSCFCRLVKLNSAVLMACLSSRARSMLTLQSYWLDVECCRWMDRQHFFYRRYSTKGDTQKAKLIQGAYPWVQSKRKYVCVFLTDDVSLEKFVVLIKPWKQQTFSNVNENQYAVLLIPTIINYIWYVKNIRNLCVTL